MLRFYRSCYHPTQPGSSPKWESRTLNSLARDIRIVEAQSPVGSALIDQAKRDQEFESPMLHFPGVLRNQGLSGFFFTLVFQEKSTVFDKMSTRPVEIWHRAISHDRFFQNNAFHGIL